MHLFRTRLRLQPRNTFVVINPLPSFQILVLSSVVAAAMAYPYPMAMPVAIAYPQDPVYMSAPNKFADSRADVGAIDRSHHGYEEHLGRVKMQVRL